MKVLSTLLLACLSLAAARVDAQPRGSQPSRPPSDTGQRLEIYGFGQADMIYDFKRNDPLWFDVNRPTKLPAVSREFGANDHMWFSARQSRFGVKGTKPTPRGDVKAQFEFDLFGVGVDAGQTTIRLRLAYGQWGQFGAGQLWSPFMDVDVFPNILDYWGPNGMIFFRNVLIFWQPYNKDDRRRFTLALERPGASGDQGLFADRIELDNILARFPAPDISAEARWGDKKWYVELAGIMRWIRWDDVLVTDTFDLAGGTTGWGLNLSSVINATPNDALRLQAIYGRGVQNYFNDAPVDIGITLNPRNPRRPIIGTALHNLGLMAYLDHAWSPRWASSIGWSSVRIDNSDGQLPSAFRYGQYGTLNALWTPVTPVMMGAELQWGYRRNFSDGFTFDDIRMQFSFKYNFRKSWGGDSR